jgi:hypothetical protein
MPTKAELSAERDKYSELLAQAKFAELNNDVVRAVELAVESLPYIDSMMQFERKYEKRTFDRIEAIDVILKFAPLLLDLRALNALDETLKTQKRIDKNADADLAADWASARKTLLGAWAVWTCLETPAAKERSDVKIHLLDRKTVGRIIEHWVRWGLVQRDLVDGRLTAKLSTNLSETVACKCSDCGAVARAAKSMLLSEVPCPHCRSTSIFVELPERTK